MSCSAWYSKRKNDCPYCGTAYYSRVATGNLVKLSMLGPRGKAMKWATDERDKSRRTVQSHASVSVCCARDAPCKPYTYCGGGAQLIRKSSCLRADGLLSMTVGRAVEVVGLGNMGGAMMCDEEVVDEESGVTMKISDYIRAGCSKLLLGMSSFAKLERGKKELCLGRAGVFPDSVVVPDAHKNWNPMPLIDDGADAAHARVA